MPFYLLRDCDCQLELIHSFLRIRITSKLKVVDDISSSNYRYCRHKYDDESVQNKTNFKLMKTEQNNTLANDIEF